MSAERVADLERQAEEAYTAMYEVEAYAAKDCYDDARMYFRQAMEAARDAGLDKDADRLEQRLEHVRSVYFEQFRGAGR